MKNKLISQYAYVKDDLLTAGKFLGEIVDTTTIQDQYCVVVQTESGELKLYAWTKIIVSLHPPKKNNNEIQMKDRIRFNR